MDAFVLCSRIFCIYIAFHLFSSELGLIQNVSTLGINYGQVANNLPSPEQVLTLLTSLKITKTRIYDTNPKILTAFANSDIELIVTVPNDLISQIIEPEFALQWVTSNIKPYTASTKITDVAVGNEIYSTNDNVLISNLVPAMKAIHQALVQLGLDPYIRVSSANSLQVLENSYPPSQACFKPDIENVMSQFLSFLSDTGSPFWINAYSYFAYKDDPSGIPLDYVLGNPNAGMLDPYTKLRYDNMLYAQVDAVIVAAARLGFGNVEVRVSETGWPSKGDENEYGANEENARAYNRNLLMRQVKGSGTPLRPNEKLEVYLFALFNEDMKPGPTSERNYGLYQPDGTMAYNVGFDQAMRPPTVSASSLIFSATERTTEKLRSLLYWIFLFFLLFKL